MTAKVERSSYGNCRLDSGAYGDFPIPVPPLAEQHRIVAKVDVLMALCDALKARLADAITQRAAALSGSARTKISASSCGPIYHNLHHAAWISQKRYRVSQAELPNLRAPNRTQIASHRKGTSAASFWIS